MRSLLATDVRVSLFAFHPELFDYRRLAFERLAAHQFNWFEHFSSIDLLHDVFGLEVCGIAEESDAEIILCVLEETFPDWPHSDVRYHPYERDRGWKAIIHKRRERKRRSYQHV
jgi:hypothetical protein